MNIIEYIILGFSIILTLSWCFKIRTKAKYDQATEKSAELRGFLMTISIILIFLLHISPFHLLWMLPVSIFLGILSVNTPLKFLWVFSSIYFSLWYIGTGNLGRKYYMAGEYDKAINAYENEISKNPSAESYFNLGLAHGKLGDNEKQIESYKQAIKLNPKRHEVYFNLGTAYDDIGNKQGAIRAFSEAIQLKPDYLKAHYYICKLYAELDDRENALKEYEIVKKIDNVIAKELALIIKMT